MATDGLKVLEGLSKTLKEMKNATIRFPLPQTEEAKLESLANSGRDFLQINPTAENAFVKGIENEIAKNPDALADANSSQKLMEAGAKELQKLIVSRIEKGGGDIKVAPLKFSTIKIKGSSKVGVDSGSLLNALRTSKPKVTNG
jgi:hypothetical protein